MSRPKLNFCQFCKQDLIRDCKPSPGQPCFMTSVGKLVDMGEQVGLTIQDMIDLLNGGLSLSDLLKSIASAAVMVTGSGGCHERGVREPGYPHRAC